MGGKFIIMIPYNDSNPRDIERYAKGLIGKTFQDVLYESRFFRRSNYRQQN